MVFFQSRNTYCCSVSNPSTAGKCSRGQGSRELRWKPMIILLSAAGWGEIFYSDKLSTAGYATPIFLFCPFLPKLTVVESMPVLHAHQREKSRLPPQTTIGLEYRPTSSRLHAPFHHHIVGISFSYWRLFSSWSNFV